MQTLMNLRGVFFAGGGGKLISHTEDGKKCPHSKNFPTFPSRVGSFSLGPKFGDQILTMGGGHRRRGGRHGNLSKFLVREIQIMIPMTEVLGGQQKNCFERFLEQLSNEKTLVGWGI